MTELTPAERAMARQRMDDITRYGLERANEPNLYAPPPSWVTSAERLKREREPVEHIVNGLLTPGATMLWGAPKAGKSTIALDIALGVANGTETLSQLDCQQGDVLYVSNETSADVYVEVAEAIGGGETDCLFTTLLEDNPPTGPALHTLLDRWIQSGARWVPKLVIIDTLDSMDPITDFSVGIKVAEQNRARLWDTWALQHNLCALLIQHDSKAKLGKDDDWTRSMTGTRGGLAGVSGLLYLQVNPGTSSGVLHATGRRLASVDLPVQRFANSRVWMATEITDEQRRYGELRLAVLTAVRAEPGGLTSQEVQARLPGAVPGTIRTHLRRLVEKGDLVQPNRGKYQASATLRLVPPS